jgi:hypothetical protein
MRSKSSSGAPGSFLTPQPYGLKPKFDLGIIQEMMQKPKEEQEVIAVAPPTVDKKVISKQAGD